MFFTAGLLFRALWRGSARGQLAQQKPDAIQPAPSAAGAAPVPDPGAYVLVALDQRRSDGNVSLTWMHSIHVAAAAGRRWAVKVLAAARNRATFDRLFAEVDRGQEWEDRDTAYVSYRTRAELRDLAMGARLVLTDLPHVAEWVRDAGRDFIWASPDGLQWFWSNGHRDELAAELAGLVSAPGVPEAAVP